MLNDFKGAESSMYVNHAVNLTSALLVVRTPLTQALMYDRDFRI